MNNEMIRIRLDKIEEFAKEIRKPTKQRLGNSERARQILLELAHLKNELENDCKRTN